MFEPTGPTDVRRVTAPLPPPPVVETRLAGRFEFEGGFPTADSLDRIFDQLDFQRACQVFLRHMMAAAIFGFVQAFRRDVNLGPTDVAISHADASVLALTGNSETVYGVAVPDTKSGPVVVEVPPRVLGFLNDQWMRPMGDMGIAGPDQGAGGRYLLVPPGYDGELPTEGFVQTIRLSTFRQWLVLRAFMGEDGDPAPAIATLEQFKIYPLAQADNPPTSQHLNLGDKTWDTIHPTDIRYFEDLAEIVDYEPLDAISREEAAELAQIGIEKGKPFEPDDRMRAILDEAAQVASFMAFAICNAPRDAWQKYPDRQWHVPPPGYPSFETDTGVPMIDDMVRMAWFATGRASAMSGQKPGVGSAYTWAYRDSDGDWIDPKRTYKLRLQGPIPAKDFWSVVVYDLWTRSMLANGQAFPSLNSYSPNVETNPDGGVDIYIGPEPPEGKEGNWIRTLPDIGWFPMIRLYGPLEPWIDKTWKPDDLTSV